MSTTSPAPAAPTLAQSLAILLRALKLPSFGRYAEEVAQKAEREGWTFGQYLHHLAELEVQERRRRRIARYQRSSELPAEKALATLNRAKVPAKVQKQLPTLGEGGFVERGENLLAFGLPGRGKTHRLRHRPRADPARLPGAVHTYLCPGAAPVGRQARPPA